MGAMVLMFFVPPLSHGTNREHSGVLFAFILSDATIDRVVDFEVLSLEYVLVIAVGVIVWVTNRSEH